MTESIPTIVVIGGGAAGFFYAVNVKSPAKVILLEKNNQLLTKVRISGGGRCNVTHNCFSPEKLVQNYPRGSKELLSPFTRFGPAQVIQWFEERGVSLKTEKDGRMFPVTDQSSTIIDTLVQEAKKKNVDIRLQSKIEGIEKVGEKFVITVKGEKIVADRVMLATGSQGYQLAKSLGHTIVEPVPSLFTFNVPDSYLLELAGISLAQVELKLFDLTICGPLLLTHWGFSGPAVLKLSAFAARLLHDCDYKATFHVNWAPGHNVEEELLAFKRGSKSIGSENPFGFPRALWKKLLESANLDPEKRLSTCSNAELLKLGQKLRKDSFVIAGKTTYKEEFVTCGGVSLKEVDFKTMESKLCSGLYFAGEILDIDGITGGFNFQNAWTTAWIAANH